LNAFYNVTRVPFYERVPRKVSIRALLKTHFDRSEIKFV